ncbi:MAG: AraC family transcriptional regulator [Sphingobacterium sp.]|nr:AraC family transcriptional regulator [Sphingobacterium sp.]
MAYAMRYPSPSYFSKIFKKIRGISPISYRHSLFS